MRRLLIFLPLLCLISCTEYADIETIVQIKEKDVSSELVEKTRQQLEKRLERAGCEEVSVKQGALPIQFKVSAKVPSYQASMAEYHTAFESAELGIWHAYRVTDPEMRKMERQLSEVPGLEINVGQYAPAVIAALTDSDSLLMAKQKIEKVFSGFRNIQFFWSAKPDEYTGRYQLYAINTKGKSTGIITNKHISDARYDLDPTRNIYTVDITMNQEGTELWSKMTRQGLKREIAMVLDDKVCVAPTVQSEITNGRTEITGDFTAEEAAGLALIISQAPLPYSLKIIGEEIILPE